MFFAFGGSAGTLVGGKSLGLRIRVDCYGSRRWLSQELCSAICQGSVYILHQYVGTTLGEWIAYTHRYTACVLVLGHLAPQARRCIVGSNRPSFKWAV
jgi:hypothetical protein